MYVLRPTPLTRGNGQQNSAFTFKTPKTLNIKFKIQKIQTKNSKNSKIQTKKRYVGYLWDSPSQQSPVFDAKGIETVRRDGCPAVSKMLEASLRLLFSTADLSLVRSYCARQWGKILANRVSLQVCV